MVNRLQRRSEHLRQGTEQQAAAVVSKDSYKSHPHQSHLWLCCVCQQKNTAYTYEVVYSSHNNKVTATATALTASQQQQLLKALQDTTLSDNTVSDQDKDQDTVYYNFPLRHPRHGHLKWPIAWANTTLDYPDYPVHIKTVTLRRLLNHSSNSSKDGALTSDLREYLNSRFPKGGIDHDHQNTIRDHLYLRTVPVTTRPKRPEERHGVDYTFLTKEEFIALEKSGQLLEAGVYDGNHYGTPKPSSDVSTSIIRSPVSLLPNVKAPGAHPSSEGKRKRNRSNVEAMTAKHFANEDDLPDESVNHKKEGSGDNSNGLVQQQQQQPPPPPQQHKEQANGPLSKNVGNEEGQSSAPISSGAPTGSGGGADSGHPDSPDTGADLETGSTSSANDPLGPLPPNWEKAYTDKGEVYFIDHNTGTSHWLDPRLSRVQKKRPEECAEDELPFGWERIDDPHYGTYYIDHVNRRTQYENPVLLAKSGKQVTGDLSGAPPPHFDLYRMSSQQQNNPAGPQLYSSGPGTFPNQGKAQSPFFTRNPNELRGQRIQCQLVKSGRGLGFTIVGGDDNVEEFLQIKSVVPNGPAWVDGTLKTGDVLVYVNNTCVLGFTHHDMVTMFQSIATGDVVNLQVCRGYPLPFDPDDPNTEIVTTMAVTSPDQRDWASELERQRSVTNGPSNNQQPDIQSMPDLSSPADRSTYSGHGRPGSADLLGNGDYDSKKSNSGDDNQSVTSTSFLTIPITKGGMGFGFTIADSGFGQKVKKILDRPRCKNLQEGDILMEIDNINVKNMSHADVVQVLKDCPRGQESNITIQRGLIAPPTSSNSSPSKNKYKKEKGELGLKPKSGFLFRSKTPTAEMMYSSSQEKEKIPNRPKTPLVDTRNYGRAKTPVALGGRSSGIVSDSHLGVAPFQRNDVTRASLGGGYMNHSYNAPGSSNALANQMSGLNINEFSRHRSPGRELDVSQNYYNQAPHMQSYNQQPQQAEYPGGYQPDPLYMNGYPEYNNQPGNMMQQQQFHGYNGYQHPLYDPSGVYGYSPGSGSGAGYRSGSLPRGRKESTSFEHSEPLPGNMTRWPRPERRPTDCIELTVTLHRQESGFGFRIVGGTEEGSQVSIGHIVPGGAADVDGRLFSGDEIIAVDGKTVLNTSHHDVVLLMQQAGNNGRVTLTIRRRIYQQIDGYGRSGGPETYPYEVTVTRRENEGFGFVIISSVSRAGSTIGRIIPGSPAERCGRLHVGDRILAVNHVDINSLHHGDIVNLIKDSGYSVVLTVGPPIDDSSSTASNSHRSSTSSMVTAQATPTVVPPTDSAGSTLSAMSNPRSASAAYPPTSGSSVHYPYYNQHHQQLGHPSQTYSSSNVFNPNHHQQFRGLSVSSYDNYHQEDQELNMLELDDQYYAVELQRGARGFGFSIRGGREFHSMPLFVLRIAIDGPAAADGRLRVGDQIIEINGINTKNMTHGDAIELIKSGGNMVRLLVRRGKMPPAALMDQAGFSPLSPTPVPGANPSVGATAAAAAAAGRPISALSQPMASNYNGFSGNNNNGMIPTPFTQSTMLSNANNNNSNNSNQYFWNQYQRQ